MKRLFRIVFLTLLYITGNYATLYAQNNSGFCGGTGTKDDPFLICTAGQLDNVRNHLMSHFRLNNDIDLTAFLAANHPVEGWEPIHVATAVFQGKFHGGGHKITGLFINRPGCDNVGLFGAVASHAMIDSLTVSVAPGRRIIGNEGVGILIGSCSGGGVYNGTGMKELLMDCTVTGSVKGVLNVGGMAGSLQDAGGLRLEDYRRVLLQNCRADVEVEGGDETGGLVGRVRCLASASSATVRIAKCSAKGWVNGRHDVGGLIGLIELGIIENCYAKGTIEANNHVGGLVGCAFGAVIKNSYAASAIIHRNNAGESFCGGLVGVLGIYSNAPDNYISGMVDNCYAAGTATGVGTPIAGGIIGLSENGIVKNSVAANAVVSGSAELNRIAGTEYVAFFHRPGTYTNNYAYDRLLLNGSTVTGTANDMNGEDKTMAGLYTQTTYETGLDWNFDEVWVMPSASAGSCEGSLPVLQWQADRERVQIIPTNHLYGTYTIGRNNGDKRDFPTFDDLQTTLDNACGIVDDVAFQVEAGTYTLNSALTFRSDIANGVYKLTIEGMGDVTLKVAGAGYRHILIKDTLSTHIRRVHLLGPNDTTQTPGATWQTGGGIENAVPVYVDNGETIVTDGHRFDSLHISGCSAGKGGAIGIYNRYNSVSVVNCVLRKNYATTAGGAVYADYRGDIGHSIIAGNSTAGNGGGIYTGEMLKLTGCTVAGNSAANGGALYNKEAANAALCDLQNNTIKGNSALRGGALYILRANIYGSTIIDNSATDNGGGIYTSDNVRFYGSIVMGNRAAAGANVSGANNLADDGAYNLTGDATGYEAAFGTSIPALAGNGGPTPTVMIKPHGAADNKIPAEVLQTWPVTLRDQRDTVRPQNQRADIGAVETHTTCTFTSKPAINVTGSADFCAGDSATLAVPRISGLYYQWFCNGSAIAGATAASYVAKETPGSYYAEVSDGVCSMYSDTLVLNVLERPNRALDYVHKSSCLFVVDSYLIFGAVENQHAYEWHESNSSGIVVSTQQSMTYTMPGTYSFAVRVQGDNGCWSRFEDTGTWVIDDLEPAPPVTVSPNVCEGSGSLTFSVPGSYTECRWKENSSSTATAGTATTLTCTAGGSHSYVVSVRGSSGCWSRYSEPQSGEIYAIPATPAITVSPDVCEGSGSLTFSVPDSYAAYEWRMNNQSNPIAEINHLVTETTAGTYAYVVRIQNENNCWSSYSAASTGTVYALPELQLSSASADAAICSGQSISPIIYTLGGSAHSYTVGGLPDGILASLSGNTVTIAGSALQAGDYNYTITTGNPYGCAEISASGSVTVLESAGELDDLPDAFIRKGGNHTFRITATGRNVSYQWYYNGEPVMGATQNFYTISNATPADNGRYHVQATYPCGVATSRTAWLDVCLPEEKIIMYYWPDVPLVNCNAATNGGYQLVAFQWYKNGTAMQDATLPYIQIPESERSAVYHCTVVTAAGDTINVCPFSLQTMPTKAQQGSVKIYPNPVSLQLTIEVDEGLHYSQAECYNMNGGLVAIYKLAGPLTTIDVSALQNSMYVWKIGTVTTTIIKQ